MTSEQIDTLLISGTFPGNSGRPTLVETHISWVLICDRFVYKIKKPKKYSFLDFSTLEKRKYYCEREITLNNRITTGIYLSVVPVREQGGRFSIAGETGEIIDYAVSMRKVNREKQMDVLLSNNAVTNADIVNLAEKIASFHKKATIIYKKDLSDIPLKFLDLSHESSFLNQQLTTNPAGIIRHAIEISNDFMKQNQTLLEARIKAGFFRDCHGDLHSRNIFLLESPEPFDCIEFNDDFRQIDVLNEVAFLCMDLDAFGRRDLSGLFLNTYNAHFPTMKTPADHLLFIYYKSYRSNIRAKVNSLRARSAIDGRDKNNALGEAKKYLDLMDSYIKMLAHPGNNKPGTASL